jgi:Beta-galactosidase, domain 2
VMPTADDPYLWVTQRDSNNQGFLFVRADSGGLERLLALQASSQQRITYRDPASGRMRVIPQYSTMSLSSEQSRLIPLQLPIRGESRLVYSTADLLGRFSYPGKTWLVFYGDPGEQAEATVSLGKRPAELHHDAIWSEVDGEATYRMQFSDRDQVVSLTREISLLLLSRQRAYRAQEWMMGKDRDLVVSDADETEVETDGNVATLQLQSRQAAGQFTVLSAQNLAGVRANDDPVPVEHNSGAQQFSAKLPTANAGPWLGKIRIVGFGRGELPGTAVAEHQLASLPKLGIWKKGITHYHASFPGRDSVLHLAFSTDDYKAIYINGQFVPEASNRAKDVMAGSQYCAPDDTDPICTVDIYYADTARPKEDLGLRRMDEEKGLRAVEWLQGSTAIPLSAEWKIEFSSLDNLHRAAINWLHMGQAGPKVIEYTFAQPVVEGEEAVWRVHLPAVDALVYLNGKYLEHHQPEDKDDDPDQRPGIYLPPSMMQREGNKLLLIMLAPPPSNLQLPLIQADADSVRKLSAMVLTFDAGKNHVDE